VSQDKKRTKRVAKSDSRLACKKHRGPEKAIETDNGKSNNQSTNDELSLLRFTAKKRACKREKEAGMFFGHGKSSLRQGVVHQPGEMVPAGIVEMYHQKQGNEGRR